MLDQFMDEEQGSFFFTSHDHEKLIHREKPYVDDALPSGNGIACLALFHLGHLIGDLRYITAAEKTFRAVWSSIEQIPYAHNTLLLGLEEFLDPAPVVIIRGGSDQIQHWQEEIFRSGLLGRGQAFAIPNDEEPARITG